MQVEQGQLRRFKTSDGELWDGRFAGQVIVILEVDYNHAPAGGSVKFLTCSRIEEGWSRLWVLENSEALDEAG